MNTNNSNHARGYKIRRKNHYIDTPWIITSCKSIYKKSINRGHKTVLIKKKG